MSEINAAGRYEIPGRGTIFTADNSRFDFDLRKLSGHDVEITHAGRVNKWKIIDIECWTNHKIVGLRVIPIK